VYTRHTKWESEMLNFSSETFRHNKLSDWMSIFSMLEVPFRVRLRDVQTWRKCAERATLARMRLILIFLCHSVVVCRSLNFPTLRSSHLSFRILFAGCKNRTCWRKNCISLRFVSARDVYCEMDVFLVVPGLNDNPKTFRIRTAEDSRQNRTCICNSQL
jgi:hypothetical protein